MRANTAVKMSVWRIENVDGRGPFWSCSDLYTEEERSMVFYGIGVRELRAPWQIDKNEKCGTTSKEGLVAWMTPVGLKILADNGFKVRRYEAMARRTDEHQVTYVYQDAVLMEEISLADLMPAAEVAWEAEKEEIEDHRQYARTLNWRDAEYEAYALDDLHPEVREEILNQPTLEAIDKQIQKRCTISFY